MLYLFSVPGTGAKNGRTIAHFHFLRYNRQARAYYSEGLYILLAESVFGSYKLQVVKIANFVRFCSLLTN